MAASKVSKQTEQHDSRDAWERFERAVDVVAKSPPQHRSKEKKNQKGAVKDDKATKSSQARRGKT
jgi:hypothetical protein